MDLSDLMSSREDEPPSGADLEYDWDYINLGMVATPTDARQEGKTFHDAQDPEWPKVKEAALAVLARAHDLRAAAFLAQASLETDGFAGFAEVTRYMRGCLEDYWDSVHPLLDAEDNNDPTARINAVQGLADPAMMLRLLRDAPLTESRNFGRFGLRELQYASGEVAPPAGVDAPDSGGVTAAFNDTAPEVLSATATAVREALANVRAIDTAFTQNLGGQGPTLDALIKLLTQIQKALAPHVAQPEAEAAEDDMGALDAEADGAAAPFAAAQSGGGGQITSSRDVTVMLDRILAYYERFEPSSPVPLILARAKRLVGADFMTIMRDLAPQGVNDVTMISGEEG